MPVRPLSAELAEKARVELNEDPSKLEDSLQHLKEWVSKQPHLRARTDDQWLAAFLRGCKFSVERTKEKIDLFYSLRTTAPELNPLKFSDPKFMEILDMGVFIFLPQTADPAGPKLLLMRPGVYDPEKYSVMDVMSVGGAIQNIMLMDDDNFVVAGSRNITDMKGATLAHFAQMNPMLMKKVSVAFQEAAPIRMKGVHYLNTPPGFETIFNFMKNFLNEKNQKRLYVHNTNFEALYEYVPKDILPVEYGGKQGTIQDLVGFKTNEETPIFISEQLTARGSRLYFLARDLTKSKKYKYCWTSFGKVYIRKDDTSKIIQILNEAQIHQLLQDK